MMLEQFLALTLLLHVSVTVSKQNEVYAGCGFEHVPGQPQTLKFCTAYGLCMKTRCGPGRIFSRSHCGCVHAVFLKPHTQPPAAVTSRPGVRNVVSDFGNIQLPVVETGVKRDANAADSFIPATPSNDTSLSLSMKASSNSVILFSKKWNTSSTERASYIKPIHLPTVVTVSVTGKPVAGQTSSLPSTLLVISKKGNKDRKTSKSTIEGNSASEKILKLEPIMELKSSSLGLSEAFPAVERMSADVTIGSNSERRELNSRKASNENSTVMHTVRHSNSTTVYDRAPQAVRTNNTYTSTVNISLLVQNVSQTGDNTDLESVNKSLPQLKKTSRTFHTPTPTTVARAPDKRFYLTGDSLRETIVKNESNILMQSELACGAEINITGMTSDRTLIGNGALGLDYVGIRGVTSHSSSAYFDGQGFMWIPTSEISRFTKELTIIMSFKANVDLQMRQELVNNCGSDGSPTVSISLDPITGLIKFKAMVISTNTPYSLQEIVETSIPYTCAACMSQPGIYNTLEMQCNGHSLIARVNNYVAGSHISSSENYELMSGANPLYIGKGCRERETNNFHGDISSFAFFRCVRS